MAKNTNSQPDPHPHSDPRVQAERDDARRQQENDLRKLDRQAGPCKGGN